MGFVYHLPLIGERGSVDLSFEMLRNHLNLEFPRIWEQINPERVTTVLLIQIKGGDVHPGNRNPEITGRKTQIDITAPTNNQLANPTTALFSEGIEPLGLTRWPVRAYDSTEERWVSTDIKVSGIDQRPAVEYTRRVKLGGREPQAWSSIVWANMGHYQTDRFGFILFIREGLASAPYSFSLPDSETLRELLLVHGLTRGTWQNPEGTGGWTFGTPRSKAAVINGNWDSGELHERLGAEYLYIVTEPRRDGPRVGWVKIGKTTRSPIQRLNEYDTAFESFDMNHIRMTSNCDEAEVELIRRLELVGYERRTGRSGNRNTEWFRTDSIETVIACVDAVVQLYPGDNDVQLNPIRRSNPGESWLDHRNVNAQ